MCSRQLSRMSHVNPDAKKTWQLRDEPMLRCIDACEHFFNIATIGQRSHFIGSTTWILDTLWKRLVVACSGRCQVGLMDESSKILYLHVQFALTNRVDMHEQLRRRHAAEKCAIRRSTSSLRKFPYPKWDRESHCGSERAKYIENWKSLAANLTNAREYFLNCTVHQISQLRYSAWIAWELRSHRVEFW